MKKKGGAIEIVIKKQKEIKKRERERAEKIKQRKREIEKNK